MIKFRMSEICNKFQTVHKVADIKGKIVPSSIIRTCTACPSQWEAVLNDGTMMYARFRWGHFYVVVSKNPVKDVMELFDQEILVLESDDVGDMNGYMTDAEFTYHLAKANLLEVSLIKRLWILSTASIADYLENRSYSRSFLIGLKRFLGED